MITMQAQVTSSYGAEARFETSQVPSPELEAGHVLIEVKATSLNPIDNKLLRKDLGFNPELPAVLHGDVAGVVSAVGPDVQGFVVGDEVYACAGGFAGTPGALAEFMQADARLVAHKSKSLSFAEAAALPLVLLTAWESLIDGADVQEGEHVLVHGGTGGVGHVAVQLAKARGARVAVTVSSDKKAEIARSLGADDVVMYRDETVEEYVKRLTDGVGFDVVYDTVGGEVFDQSLRATRIRGRVATVTGASGNKTLTSRVLSATMPRLPVHRRALDCVRGRRGETTSHAIMSKRTARKNPSRAAAASSKTVSVITVSVTAGHDRRPARAAETATNGNSLFRRLNMVIVSISTEHAEITTDILPIIAPGHYS